jgi:hypothetical protein
VIKATVPAKSTVSDYEYGAAREAIAQASLFATALERYCSSTPTGLADSQCSSDKLDSTDFAWKMLGAYGLQGKITIPREGESWSKISMRRR